MRPFVYERAGDLAQALRLGRGPGPAQYLAGGTTLVDLMKLDVLRPERVIDITALAREHSAIEVEPGRLRLGALTRMAVAAADPGVRSECPALAQSLTQAASAQLRNMATLGGNVLQRTRCPYYRDVSWSACNKRTPGSGCAAVAGTSHNHAVLGADDSCISQYPGDFGVALVAMAGEVELIGPSGARRLAFEALHRPAQGAPHLETNLRPGEMITGFVVPTGAWSRRSLYLKIRDRASYEFALASAAVGLAMDGDVVREARIGLGGVAYRPWRAREAEAVLAGRPLTEASAEDAARAAFAGANARGGNAFKIELGRRTLVRALLQAGALPPAAEVWIAEGENSPRFGVPTPRIDGAAKVTGQARYASDEPVAKPAFAVLVTSAIARGRVTGFDLAAAKATPGVLDILTHETVGQLAKPPPVPGGGEPTTTLETDRIWHDGQIIAVVVADTFEAAREAAYKVKVGYAAEPPSASFGRPGVTVEAAKPPGALPSKGDAEAALAAAPVKVDARYSTPAQHHNALELFTTTCAWDGPRLTIYEGSQTMWGLKTEVAHQLGIDPANVRTVSRFVGGSFGSRGATTARTAWIAVAARRVGRPVKLAPRRDQGFTIATYRAETQQRLALGADRDGRLTALIHQGSEVTSRPGKHNVAGVGTTARMYACPNIATAVDIVHADRNTPGYMRAPPETPYMFALESGMDELAYALGLDPIELRRRNEPAVDPVSGMAFSSRSLMACFDQAAARFGWSRRDPKPGSMREGDWLIGFGCASSVYPSNVGPAAARLSLTPDGKATVELAAHEIGNGAYTLVAITAADGLGLKVADVTVRLGDSALPPVSIAGGSNNAASTANVVHKACEAVRAKLAAAAAADPASAFHGRGPSTLRLQAGALVGADGAAEPLARAMGRAAGGVLEVHAEFTPAGIPDDAVAGLYKGKIAMLSGVHRKDASALTFGAHLVEVRVHARTREIRVPRVVSAFAAGTIVNPLTAYSQFMGGAIWGLSAALFEQSVVDPASARYVNTNFADYLIPTNADVPDVQIIIVPERDEQVNPLGIKGIGEVGIVGMNAAVANAVFHATGRRIRDLPIRAEALL